MVCRLALSIAKDREDDSAPGNWTKVIADCEEKSSVLLSNLPTSDFQQTYAQLASMVKTNYISVLLRAQSTHRTYKLILACTSIFTVIYVIAVKLFSRITVIGNRLYGLGLYPCPFRCTPTVSWIFRSLLFFVFVGKDDVSSQVSWGTYHSHRTVSQK